MEDLTKLLNAQKDQIQKDLEKVGHDMFTLKIQESKLKKMLKAVNSQIELAKDEPSK